MAKSKNSGQATPAVTEQSPAKAQEAKKPVKARWGDDQPSLQEHLAALHENNPQHPGSRAQKALLAQNK